ncbi:helix-turn-helix domain-containing protein [Xanthobacter sp. KR7-65]|uniref:helix-turn-helix domain-containing protein n=1 Tax=Xanthobacter sp. KR7-65 TaxID=3156612 RepID=UPI0032B53F90
MDTPNALTVEDVAERLHVSRSGIYALIKAGGIGFYKVGRKIRFTEANVRDYIERSGRAARARAGRPPGIRREPVF